MKTRSAAVLLIAGALGLACRNPQDPSRSPVVLPDGGPSPPAPEVQPDTGKPIGPIAGEPPLQIPPSPSAGAGGRGPIGGSGGAAGGGAGPGTPNAKATG